MHEFNLIERYFRPLSTGFKGSLGLTDDAALIDIPHDKELVATVDGISEGVHFLGSENPALIARKLLRVNLSDLAAMGATPLCYLLTVMLPKTTDEEWVKNFAHGLKQDQEHYRIHLTGGDTIATLASLSFSLTAFGTVDKNKALKRSAAKVGDRIYVSGTLGDSALGLALLQSALTVSQQDQRHLEHRYFLPEPRTMLGQKLVGIANSCMDISDGLLQDLGHICTASDVGAAVHRKRLPLSTAAQSLLQKNDALWDKIVAGGDDYELLFTAPASKATAIDTLSKNLSLPITHIGEITSTSGVQLLDESGKMLTAQKGYTHF